MKSDRKFKIKTPFGDAAVLFQFSGNEQMGRPFAFHVSLLSEDPDLDFNKAMGQPMTVTLEKPDGSEREFSGVCAHMSLQGMIGGHYHYDVELVPWLSVLHLTSNSRIFQSMKIPEIIKQVFRDAGFADFREVLAGERYASRDFVVQYRETDFDFVSRLMEQEGIYYFFEHKGGKHILVMADSRSGHDTVKGYEKVPFFPPIPDNFRERDHIDSVRRKQRLVSGKTALNDYDFKKPKANLKTASANPAKQSHADLELYDYPGQYIETKVGQEYTRTRLEAAQAFHETLTGGGNAMGLGCGYLFKLTEHPAESFGKTWLIIAAEYNLQLDLHESGTDDSGEPFRFGFTAIPESVTYRSPRETRIPVVPTQTATVVGPSGEEIWTDEYGRIKVQFHWDREGKKDDKSSCWVRVSQAWAGSGFGSMHIPRIGQEVIVGFLEGDPDQPIVTGRVYNNDNKPPYPLPDNKTQSGIKSRSSKGGNPDNFNEIRFEDKKGEEEMFFHAEKNRVKFVKNDQTLEVGHDETNTIKNNRTEDVGKDETITIGENRTESVGKDETITVGGNRDETVDKNESVSIGGNRSLSVDKDNTERVTGKHSLSVDKDATITVKGKYSTTITKDETHEVTGERTAKTAKGETINVGKKLQITAGDEIVLKTGSASITMKKDGTIQIKGKDITITGSGKINVKASQDLILKGSKIAQN